MAVSSYHLIAEAAGTCFHRIPKQPTSSHVSCSLRQCTLVCKSGLCLPRPILCHFFALIIVIFLLETLPAHVRKICTVCANIPGIDL